MAYRVGARGWLGVTAWWVVGLVALPIVGIGVAANQSVGLWEPPPLSMARLVPLGLRTLALALCVSVFSLLLGTWLGWLAAKARYRASRLLATLGILPIAIPSYLLAAILREDFAPNGWIGSVLGNKEAFAGFGAAVFVLTLACTPYVQLLVLAGLRSLSSTEEEAARSLGAGAWTRFWKLSAPRLRPSWAFALVLVSLYVVSDFGAVAVLDCHVLTWELYNAKGGRDAYRIALGIVVCVVPLLAAVRWLHGYAGENPRQGGPRADSLPPQIRGVPLLLAYLGHFLMVGLGVFVPLVTLVIWVLQGLYQGLSFASVMSPLLTTFLYAGIGSLIVLAVSFLPAAYASQVGFKKKGIEHGTYATSSLPGVLLAFGILHLVILLERNVLIEWRGVSLWSGLESLSVFLFLGYVMRFLSQGYAAIKPSILQVDLRLVDTARSLGAGLSARLRHVWLPGIWPGIAVAYVLLFVAVAKELPITLMLIPAGSQTLAYRIFDAQTEASLPDVGLAGLLLIVLVLGVQLIVGRIRYEF